MLMFTKNNTHTNEKTKIVNGDKTFCDSSSRTESLRRNTKRGLKQNVKDKASDLNLIKHTMYSVRNAGGIPKKCC